MLQAIVADVASLPGFTVVTTLDSSLNVSLGGEVLRAGNVAEELDLFQRLLGQVDAVMVIAPETDGILADRCRQVRESGVTSWNCLPSAIEICADKLLLAEHLQSSGLPTIPTHKVSFDQLPVSQSFPLVLKPIDGAGSWLTFLVQNESDWRIASTKIQEAGADQKCIAQPLIHGRPLSVGIVISLDGERVECLSVCEQTLSSDGRFRYLGGGVPATISRLETHAIESLVIRACRSIPGLFGYVGVDLLLTDAGQPILVEINPRLTTSYIGYREFYATNLPNRWLSTAAPSPISQRTGDRIEFTV